MRRGILAGLVALGLLLPGGAAARAESAPRPNIVIFYIDDAPGVLIEALASSGELPRGDGGGLMGRRPNFFNMAPPRA